jgi:ABC-type polysaccharide/polyol phosphate export permease
LLAARDITLRYRQTLLGVAWVVAQPIVSVLLFTFIFGHLIGAESDGVPYPVFVLAGVVVWTYTGLALNAAARSLVDGHDLVTRIYFPRLAAPIAAALAATIDLSVMTVVLILAGAVYGAIEWSTVLLAVPLLLLLTILVAALGWWAAALSVRYRDVRQLIGYALQLGFFVTPIVYSSGLLSGWERALFALNPLVGVIDSFRWCVLGAPAPPPVDLLSLTSAAFVVLASLSYFARSEPTFADVI